MKAVVQRVSRADVTINHKENREIGAGLLVLLGVMEEDREEQADFLAKKLVELRIFTDEHGKMNLSLQDVAGEMMIVSNFTLGADCRKGRRPSYTQSAEPEVAKKLYEYLIHAIKQLQVKNVQTGEFGADMQISLVNDGPVTIVLDTKEMGK